MTPKAAAASATARPWGPTVSWTCVIGTTPARLVRPTVGLMATTPFALPGHTMLPSVSVPNETAAKLAEAAAPEPELEPQGLRSRPDRKSTRLNSSHLVISYAVLCLKKK